MRWLHVRKFAEQNFHPNGDSQDAFGNELGRNWGGQGGRQGVTTAGSAIALALVDAAISPNLDFDGFRGFGTDRVIGEPTERANL